MQLAVITLGPRIAVSALLMLAGVALVVVGSRGMRGTLPRNIYAGVRTSRTLKSDEAFRVANRVAGLPTLIAGALLALTGLLALASTENSVWITVVVLGAIGTAVIAIAGGVLGHRAAAAVPNAPASSGCAGCCGGVCAKN